MIQQEIDWTQRTENNLESQRILYENKDKINRQCRIVLDALLRGERLTVRDAMLRLQIGDLRRRCADLREHGIAVKSNLLEKRFKEYYLRNMDINLIKPNPDNPRLIKDEKFKQLVKSIQDFPEMLELRPIVVNDQNMVLGGNMRLKACKEAGLTDVPVIQASKLTLEQQKEFIIKDNVGFGEWDWDTLGNEWDADQLMEWGLDIPDFKMPGAVEDDYEIPDEIETDIVLGDLFEIGQHRLLCGDSTKKEDVERLMGGEKADLVLTDPPYDGSLGGAGFNASPDIKNRVNKMQKSIENLYTYEPLEILNSIGEFCKTPISMFFFCNKKLVPEYINFALGSKKGFDLLLWHKPNFLPMAGQHYFPDTEYIIKIRDKGSLFVNGLGKIVNYGTYWEIESLKGNKKEGVNHPTIKPQKILCDCIQITTKEDFLILDLFIGSGSTMVAAHQLNRKCYGMEIDPKYCQVIVDRMLKLDPAIEIKKNGEPYFIVDKQLINA
jgi:DNA modification methylase